MRRLLLLVLAACNGGSDDGSKSDPTTDTPSDTDTDTDSDTDTDTDTIPLYGPPNSWYHVPLADIPAGLSGNQVAVGKVMPNFTMKDRYGDDVELYQFYGKAIYLDIIAEWCEPCQNGAPYLEETWVEHQGDDLVVIGVMVYDMGWNNPDSQDVEDWSTTYGLTYPVLADPSALFGFVTSVPMVYLIDREMRVQHEAEGFGLADLWDARWFAGSTGDPEVCDDGVDNDGDLFADCGDPNCRSVATCDEVREQGELTPCDPFDPSDEVVDVWQVTTDNTAGIFVDTTKANTAFDVKLYRVLTPGGYTADQVRGLGDDEIDCTFPPPDFACPATSLPPGTWEVVVTSAGSCANETKGQYAITVWGENVSLTQLADDTPDFIPTF